MQPAPTVAEAPQWTTGGHRSVEFSIMGGARGEYRPPSAREAPTRLSSRSAELQSSGTPSVPRSPGRAGMHDSLGAESPASTFAFSPTIALSEQHEEQLTAEGGTSSPVTQLTSTFIQIASDAPPTRPASASITSSCCFGVRCEDTRLETLFMAHQARRWYSTQRLATCIMLALVLFGWSVFFASELLQPWALPLQIISTVAFIALRLGERHARRAAEHIGDDTAPPEVYYSTFSRLSALQCVVYGVTFVGSLARTLVWCRPETDPELLRLMTTCHGFQHEVHPAGFLVWYFLFPYVLVLVYRPMAQHAAATLFLIFFVGPAVVGSVVPMHFGGQASHISGLVVLVGLNTLLANYVTRVLARSDRESFLHAASLRASLLALQRKSDATKAAERAELKASTRAGVLHEVVSFLAHEIRNPMHAVANLVGGVAEQLSQQSLLSSARSVASEGDAVADLEAALSALQQLLWLTEDSVLLNGFTDAAERSSQSSVHVQSWLLALSARCSYPSPARTDVELSPTVPSRVEIDNDIVSHVVFVMLRHVSSRAEAYGSGSVVKVNWNAEEGLMELHLSAPGVPQREQDERADGAFRHLSVPLCRSAIEAVGGKLEVDEYDSGAPAHVLIVAPAVSAERRRASRLRTTSLSSASSAPIGARHSASLTIDTSADALDARAGPATGASRAVTESPVVEEEAESGGGGAEGGGLGESSGRVTPSSAKRFLLRSSDVALPRPLHCLVVEDEKTNLRVTCAMLKRLGCTFETAMDGAEVDTGDVARREQSPSTERPPFDVILTDIVMPRMSGDTLARVLRDNGVKAPVIATTSNVDERARRQYQRSGIRHIVAKPFALSDLRATLVDARLVR